jgi:hypothetical protein
VRTAGGLSCFDSDFYDFPGYLQKLLLLQNIKDAFCSGFDGKNKFFLKNP